MSVLMLGSTVTLHPEYRRRRRALEMSQTDAATRLGAARGRIVSYRYIMALESDPESKKLGDLIAYEVILAEAEREKFGEVRG